MRTLKLLSCLALFATTGCATVIEGRTQDIAVDTMPEGATCVLKANDEVLGVIEKTPGHVLVDKSKYDIVTECSKDGYIKAKEKNHADMALASLGNYAMLTYSFIGSGIDNATGAANKYDSHMLLTLDADKDFKQVAQLAPPAAPVPVAAAPAAITQPPLEQPHPPLGKYATVEDLSTKKPEVLPPALPHEQAVPYMEVTSASLGKPLPAVAAVPAPVPAVAPAVATAATPPASVQVAAAQPALVPVAAMVDKVPAFIKAVPKPAGKVTQIANAATIQMAQLSDEQCHSTIVAVPENPW